MNLFACPTPDPADKWLVVGSIEITPATRQGRLVDLVIHYRYRTLLPSARALLALLGCFPKGPRIDSVTLTKRAAWTSEIYTARVKGSGLAPLSGVEVIGIEDRFIDVDLSQRNDREIQFEFVVRNPIVPSRHAFRIETEFDVIHSADCGIWLDISESVPINLFPFDPEGPIGGGIL